ncbi:hypothetical protein [Nocardioides pantholopis]|uniref:hypothetical protein n=1 Tax=Nocardioides pantholopis TaxID=2483798 RepID=UPI000F076DD0|nr:hypothetical protein [Nocardioides pantholopis]
MLSNPLFNSIETRYPAGPDATRVRDIGPEETLRIVYRDTDLHLYVLPTAADPAAGRAEAPSAGADFELHVVHTKITRLTQQQLVFEGFAVPEQPGRAYPRVGVTLHHRADLAPAAGRAAVAPPSTYAGFTRLATPGGGSGLDLPYVAQRSPEQPPTRGTVFVDVDYLARFTRTDATGAPLPVHDADPARRLAMTTSGLARRASALDAEALVRTDTLVEVWDALFAPAPGQHG